MMEMNDYSGPFNPDLTFNDFSKEFLLKLIETWQWAWIQLDSSFFDPILKRSDLDTCIECATEVWMRIAETCNHRFAEIAKIRLSNAVDCLKVLQLPLDNTMGTIYHNVYDIKNENLLTAIVEKCPSLEWFEKNAPERIVPVCHHLEGSVIDKYKVNMDVEFTQLKLPPRQSPDDIACSFQLELVNDTGGRVRGKEEVVDETTEIPELDDLSGPFYPNLTHRNFSKQFLLKMMDAWQFAWITMADGYFNAIKKRFGFEAACETAEAAWGRVAQKVNPMFIKIADIKLNTVLDSLKCLQLPMDNNIGPICSAGFDVKNENHVIMTTDRCRMLEHYEKKDTQLIEAICHGCHGKAIEHYLLNPSVGVKPLKLPPRASQDEIACSWELTMGK